ncbi:MAG: TetR/AcrR family transcriptional regulator C-terminal domain-containing protein [Austwickia sp.]|nr:TetR/AcrR family transcriptional regulator C-terminal domain-containing protein [Austwickia sp.]
MALNRQDVLTQAVATLDRYGFADLSMRRLAASLGVQPGALYWHFANKQTLLLAVAEVILEPVLRSDASAADRSDPAGEGPAPSGPSTGEGPAATWRAAVGGWAQTLRSALLAHRDGAEVVASVLALRPRSLDPACPCVAALRAAGMGETEARAAAAALVHYTVGHAVDAQTHAQAVALGVREVHRDGATDDEAAAAQRFGFGLEVFLDGLARRLP